MRDEHKGDAAVGRHGGEELLESVQPAGRGADAGHGRARPLGFALSPGGIGRCGRRLLGLFGSAEPLVEPAWSSVGGLRTLLGFFFTAIAAPPSALLLRLTFYHAHQHGKSEMPALPVRVSPTRFVAPPPTSVRGRWLTYVRC